MKRPLIGISTGIIHPDPERSLFNGRELHFTEWSMVEWVSRAGGIAVAIPYPLSADADYWRNLVEAVDGIVLHGGADVAPGSYGQQALQPEWAGDGKRDASEIALVHAARAANTPVLGVCRGHQLINVALGGTLYQDISTQVPQALQHRNAALYQRNRHGVTLAPESHLSSLYGGAHTGTINSVHHQAIDELGEGLIVEARSSDDDIIEAIRLNADSHSDPWIAGVQWHPEFQHPESDKDLLDPIVLLDDFFEAIALRASD